MRSTLGSGRFGLGDSEIEDTIATFAGDDLLKLRAVAQTELVDGVPALNFSRISAVSKNVITCPGRVR